MVEELIQDNKSVGKQLHSIKSQLNQKKKKIDLLKNYQKDLKQQRDLEQVYALSQKSKTNKNNPAFSGRKKGDRQIGPGPSISNMSLSQLTLGFYTSGVNKQNRNAKTKIIPTRYYASVLQKYKKRQLNTRGGTQFRRSNNDVEDLLYGHDMPVKSAVNKRYNSVQKV